jgi:HK97 gp10 family phage protein
MDIRITTTGLDQFVSKYRRMPQAVRAGMVQSMTRVVIQGEAISKRLVRKKTGTTARSITHKVRGGGATVIGEWGSVYKVAKWLELGTRPHRIVGNPWLYWPGAAHPVRAVNHPGTRPYPFIRPAGRQIRPIVRKEFQAMLRRVVAGAR